MKLDPALKRKVLYHELYNFLKALDPKTEKEVLFSRFMETTRKFRADFFCPKLSLVVEVNGGQFVQGRHNRGGENYEKDLTKLNLAQANGFSILQFTYQMLERREYKKIILNYCQSVR